MVELRGGDGIVYDSELGSCLWMGLRRTCKEVVRAGAVTAGCGHVIGVFLGGIGHMIFFGLRGLETMRESTQEW